VEAVAGCELRDLTHKGRRKPQQRNVELMAWRDKFLERMRRHSQSLAGILYDHAKGRGVQPHEKAQGGHSFIPNHPGRDSFTVVHLDHFRNDAADWKVHVRDFATIEEQLPGVNGNEVHFRKKPTAHLERQGCQEPVGWT
jgi:hypothetical protein